MLIPKGIKITKIYVFLQILKNMIESTYDGNERRSYWQDLKDADEFAASRLFQILCRRI